MENLSAQKQPVDKWIIDPMKRFINNSSMSGIVLFSSALIALILANSPWSEEYLHFWHKSFSIGFNGAIIDKTLHHWINDGLMAVFFFVVGLELKREIIAGELRNPKNAILPMAAAIGGMAIPALIYLSLNHSGEASNGWGIPMATDIAFALGILYLLGDKVPISLKIFLTVLAIADDIGAVLVIAFFYTSDINFYNLLIGAIFMIVLIIANSIGVRNTIFYAIVGIGGLWLAFLLSGVHATIAAVLAALTIPANVKMTETNFSIKMDFLLNKFKNEKTNNAPTVTPEQLHILEEIKNTSKAAFTPLQRLEHTMHPIVAFVIMPIFALCNAGVVIEGDFMAQILSPVAIGVMCGLLIGKILGVVGVSYIMIKLKLAKLPNGMNMKHVLGVGFLAAIGFTMSLFITDLAFKNNNYILQAKLGILVISVLCGAIGYLIIKNANKN